MEMSKGNTGSVENPVEMTEAQFNEYVGTGVFESYVMDPTHGVIEVKAANGPAYFIKLIIACSTGHKFYVVEHPVTHVPLFIVCLNCSTIWAGKK